MAFSKAQIATSIGVTQDDLLFVGTNQFDIYVRPAALACWSGGKGGASSEVTL